MVKMPLNI